jgi:hypothetical protein
VSLNFGSDSGADVACVMQAERLSLLTRNSIAFIKSCNISLQLLAMDPSARVTMKDAAKCDKRCEWQNSANQENAERILRF